jgi:hypothetical protein
VVTITVHHKATSTRPGTLQLICVPVFLQVGTPAFNPYLDAYLEYEVLRLQGVLRMLSIDYVCLNRLHSKVAGRPNVQKSVRASMQRLEKGMQEGLSKLQDLLQRGMQRLPQDLQAGMGEHASWSVDQLKHGRLFVVGAMCWAFGTCCTQHPESPHFQLHCAC